MKQMVFFSKKDQHYLKIELMSIFVTKVNVLSQIYAQMFILTYDQFFLSQKGQFPAIIIYLNF